MLALILAGGESSRMGQDKAWLSYHEKPEIERIYELLSCYCSEVYVSLRRSSLKRNPSFLKFPLIFDKHEGNKPILEAILDAVETRSHEHWLVCCCDLPLLDALCIEKLLDSMRRVEQQAYCYHLKGHSSQANPVLFVFSRLGPKQIHNIRDSGEQSLRKLLNKLSPMKLDDKKNQLAQANTPIEKTSIETRLHTRPI